MPRILSEPSSVCFPAHRVLLAAVLIGLAGWFAPPAAAQSSGSSAGDANPAEDDAAAPPAGPPIAVINVASIERILDDIDYLFGSVDRADMTEVVDGLLGNIGDLKGLKRDKPFGVMVFLKPGLVPQPAVIGYLPVEDAAALSKTIELGPAVTKKTADDRYEIIGRRQTFYARMVGDYAFVADDDLLLDREFPVPQEDFANLVTRYDVAAEVRPENMPPGMRDLFLNLLRTNAQAELQKRDGESETAYAFRKSQGMDNLRMVEALLKETRSLTLGLDTSRENRKAVLELVVEAIPDTPYLELLQSLAEEPSRFAALLDDEVPLAASLNSKLDDYAKTSQTELLNAGERELALRLTRMEQGEAAAEPATDAANRTVLAEPNPADLALAGRIFGPLKETVKAGNLDAFLQFRGDPEKKFVAVGGVEIPGAAGMESAVREVIDRIRAAQPAAESAIDVQYGFAEAGGVSLHRVSGPQDESEGNKKMWGGSPALYVGFDADAIWIALGGSQAVDVLNETVTRVKEAGPAERNRAVAPFQILLTANRWVGLDSNEDNTALAREAFENGDDTLRFDFRPTEKGGRLRIEIEEGFIRLLGLGVSKRYDRSQL